jgi:hypothetical protein
MIYRMKILLALIQELGGDISEDKLHLYLFLFCHEFSEHNHYYHFIPTPSGPHSLQAEEDRRYLISKKLLTAADNWVVIESKKRYAVDLDFFEKMGIQKMKNQLSTASRQELLAMIFSKYPYYETSNDNRPSASHAGFYTIGYEGISPEQYINRLIEHDVKLLCDVRRNPLSKKFGFSKQELAGILPQLGIEYMHIPELGIASDKRQNLDTDQDYRALFTEYVQTTLPKQQGKLELLEQLLADKQRIAITCFEADVCYCHRGKIAEALRIRPTFAAPIKHL